MKEEVIIMSGLPGSGKSTKARNLKVMAGANRQCTLNEAALILSSDDYFMVANEYRFDPSKIGEAHKDCFSRFMQAVVSEEPVVIVDNTNIEPWEIAPYWTVANALDYRVRIVEVHASLKSCVERNRHGVPYGVIRSMQSRFQTRTLPAHWRVEPFFSRE